MGMAEAIENRSPQMSNTIRAPRNDRQTANHCARDTGMPLKSAVNSNTHIGDVNSPAKAWDSGMNPSAPKYHIMPNAIRLLRNNTGFKNFGRTDSTPNTDNKISVGTAGSDFLLR